MRPCGGSSSSSSSMNNNSWTLPSLVGAYLDLALAYLLLWGATLAYLVTKFLSLFGLPLPCCCHDLRPLTDHKIASVHASLSTRFPFDSSVFSTHPLYHHLSSSRLPVTDGADANESCGSTGPQNLSLPPINNDGRTSSSSHGRALDAKGKGLLLLQPSSSSGVLRRRRRIRKTPIPAQGLGQGKPPPPPSPSTPPLLLGWQRGGASSTPFYVARAQWSVSGESSAPADTTPCSRLPAATASDDAAGVHGATPSDENAIARMSSPCGTRDMLGSYGGNEVSIIREMESMLQEEQAARAALYVDLEKERSAAATAADEAMAMILRLQEEKAAVEMEARQYHRMIEEKSAYDEEEMEILKEIIVRREREKYVLEKEVEVYRQMMQSGCMGKQQLDGDQQAMGCLFGPLYSSSQDPVLMLQRIYETFGTKESGDHIHRSVADHDSVLTDGKQGFLGDFSNGPLSIGLADDVGSSKHGNVTGQHYSEMADPGYESSLEFQEKGMITTEAYPSRVQSTRSSYEENPILNKSQVLSLHEASPHLVNEEDNARKDKVETRVPIQDSYRESDEDREQRVSPAFPFEAESVIHDIHIIDDRLTFGDSGNGNTKKLSQTGGTSTPQGKGASLCQNFITDPNPTTTSIGVNQDIRRSCLDMSKGGQLKDNLCGKASPFHLRRSSMSAVDIEKSKLEAEVELLMKRLKIIQQGREKLGFSVDHRENETCQLQLLEEISCQLQEIRKITDPKKSIRQASLPPPSSKVTSKKQRRSVSWGVHNSS